jgi:predicted ArsR family transcriptional regulator
LARSSDPQSSHIAAAEVTSSGRRANQKRALLAWLRGQSQAMTSAEIAVAAEMDRHAVARRLPDLARDGLVKRCPMRTCGAMGTPAITWMATR